MRAAEVCAVAMRSAASLAAEVSALPGFSDRAIPIGPRRELKTSFDSEEGLGATQESTEQALAQLERCAKELGELRRDHRRATLSSVAGGALTADEAITRVDAVRRLEAIAHHAWRSAAHLLGRSA
jgi:phosphate:Na+ symporter